jgi:hypothetical protein
VSPRSTLDHLVVACRDLAQGAAWLRGRLGVDPQPGGKHKAMGTHNAVLRLGARRYLELIATDPNAPKPVRPRWFGLDDPALQRRAAEAPFLLSWVVRSSDVARAVELVPLLGDVVALSRGVLAWRITIPADGWPPLGGALPAVIEWVGEIHPCDTLEERGCELVELRIAHPQAELLRTSLAALGVEGPCSVHAGERALSARIRTPRGEVLLS